MTKFSKARASIPALFVIAVPAVSGAQEIIRHEIPGSDFPISRAVEIPPEFTTVYLSGAVPSVVDENAPQNSLEAYGDTEAQTVSVLRSIEKTLADIGLEMSDIIKMQAFLVAPGSDGMDFSGFMRGYSQFFGTEDQPNLPVRSVVEVAGLADPAWLVEIEVTAARK